jgi:hypothetical protein
MNIGEITLTDNHSNGVAVFLGAINVFLHFPVARERVGNGNVIAIPKRLEGGNEALIVAVGQSARVKAVIPAIINHPHIGFKVFADHAALNHLSSKASLAAAWDATDDVKVSQSYLSFLPS